MTADELLVLPDDGMDDPAPSAVPLSILVSR
jgi:hypothetical protein